MLNRICWGLVAGLLFSISAEALTIGPAQTKKERESQSVSAGRVSSGAYEKVVESFLKEDFARAEILASRYLKRGSKDAHYDEVSYLRALSMMKLGRFAEAEPILREIEQEASADQMRAQVAYSLGDAYYFRNQRDQADAYYQEALRKYPNAGEAVTIRKVLGLSNGHTYVPIQSGGPTLSRQWAVEEIPQYTVQVGAFGRERNAERLLNKLLRNRYDAFISREEAAGRFRVRVGHLQGAEEARQLEARLKKDGYPTKIFP